MWVRRKFCSMSNCFHLAVEAGDLAITRQWYVDVLGCDLDMSEEGKCILAYILKKKTINV